MYWLDVRGEAERQSPPPPAGEGAPLEALPEAETLLIFASYTSHRNRRIFIVSEGGFKLQARPDYKKVQSYVGTLAVSKTLQRVWTLGKNANATPRLHTLDSHPWDAMYGLVQRFILARGGHCWLRRTETNNYNYDSRYTS